MTSITRAILGVCLYVWITLTDIACVWECCRTVCVYMYIYRERETEKSIIIIIYLYTYPSCQNQKENRLPKDVKTLMPTKKVKFCDDSKAQRCGMVLPTCSSPPWPWNGSQSAALLVQSSRTVESGPPFAPKQHIWCPCHPQCLQTSHSHQCWPEAGWCTAP